MQQTANRALSADATLSVLDELCDVQSTAANLSNYRATLSRIANPMDCWAGLLAKEVPGINPQDTFYPLMRIDSVELPAENNLGRLKGVLFLTSAAGIYKMLQFARNAVQHAGNSAPLALAFPRVAPPVPECPVAERDRPPCSDCSWWAHCATGKKVWAQMAYIAIHPYHFRMCTNVRNVWMDKGSVCRQISFRWSTQKLPFTDDARYDLTVSNGGISALPQYHDVLTRPE